MSRINELRDGEEFVGFYLIKESEIKQTNTTPPKDFMNLTLSDASGQAPAKLWDAAESDKEQFKALTLVKVQGIVQLYREKIQLKVNRIRKATEADGVTLTDFIRAAPVEPETLVARIHAVKDGIADTVIRTIVAYCLDKAGERLYHAPAAKTHHHAYYAGLAYHIVRMLELGEFICAQRPFLNADLVKAGIILHDIAKPEEMISELGIVSDYSNAGKLIGHIALASLWIAEAAQQSGIAADSERVLALQHLVLSHHNLGEWGSPVQPQIAEAVALHYIDSLDAKLQMIEDALDTAATHEDWTPQVRGLENKAFYRLKW
ncbi:3'-5' exoribonuclease YhaM family protein [Paenibacillus sacheonensis]|uniref:HD domain-containing protein n=1 Tax=Paenibacillus sacheonensis TaxID=742054 RepID=A0A7X4YNE6_9BACL|nr:HD domain-containing protein [Paenibacillus sacheonensis]MBM7565491.1 3'-5' exoribonuclease [Paenibacillus sacheonensis]NBC69581.1 HD domain-containing protein [Paenibacillus sacheonensis]